MTPLIKFIRNKVKPRFFSPDLMRLKYPKVGNRLSKAILRCPGTESLTQKSMYSYNFQPDFHYIHGPECVLSYDKVE